MSNGNVIHNAGPPPVNFDISFVAIVSRHGAFVEQGRNAHLADLVFPAFTAFRSAHTSKPHKYGMVKKRNKESFQYVVNRFEGLGEFH